MSDAQQLAAQILDQVEQIEEHPLLVKTELYKLQKQSSAYKNTIWLKCEDQQLGQTHRIRSILNYIVKQPRHIKERGFISGHKFNQAYAAAIVCQELGVPLRIVLPQTMPNHYTEILQSYKNISLLLFGNNYQESKQQALLMQRQYQMQIIPSASELILAGNAMIAKEICQRRFKKLTVFVPLNDGCLAAGLAVYIKKYAPHFKVIAVVRKNHLRPQLILNKKIDRNTIEQTISDEHMQLRCHQDVEYLISEYVDEAIAVSREQTFAAIRDIYAERKVIVEPMGAMALAGAKKYYQQNKTTNENAVAISTDGNLNFESLRYISSLADYGDMQQRLLMITHSNQDQLPQLLQDLGNAFISEIHYEFKTDKFGVLLKIQSETTLIEQLHTMGYTIEDLTNNDMAKLHLRYFFLDKSAIFNQHDLFHIELPEVAKSIYQLVRNINIYSPVKMLHYCDHGTEVGKLLLGLELEASQKSDIEDYLRANCLRCINVTDNKAFNI